MAQFVGDFLFRVSEKEIKSIDERDYGMTAEEKEDLKRVIKEYPNNKVYRRKNSDVRLLITSYHCLDDKDCPIALAVIFLRELNPSLCDPLHQYRMLVSPKDVVPCDLIGRSIQTFPFGVVHNYVQ